MSSGLDLLAAILSYGSATSFKEIKKEYISGEEEELVYNFIKAHYKTYQEIPTIKTVRDECNVDLPDVSEPISFYIRRVLQRYTYNQVRIPFNSMRKALIEQNIDAAFEAASQFKNLEYEYRQQGLTREIIDASDGVSLVLDDYFRRKMSGNLSGITTGWDCLDVETDGYQNGDFVVWTARTGMGKSFLLLYQAYRAWQAGNSIMFVNMEMNNISVMRRLVGIATGIDPKRIKRGMVSTWSEPLLSSTGAMLRSNNRFHIIAGNFKKNIDGIDNYITDISPDIIYIDGFYLVSPGEKYYRSKTEKIALLTDEVKNLTIIRNRPIVVVHKFNREGGFRGTKGTIDNLALADELSTHCSLAFAIKDSINHDIPENFRTIETLKGREGESGTFDIRYQFRPVNFSAVDMVVETNYEEDLDSGEDIQSV